LIIYNLCSFKHNGYFQFVVVLLSSGSFQIAVHILLHMQVSISFFSLDSSTDQCGSSPP